MDIKDILKFCSDNRNKEISYCVKESYGCESCYTIRMINNMWECSGIDSELYHTRFNTFNEAVEMVIDFWEGEEITSIGLYK